MAKARIGHFVEAQVESRQLFNAFVSWSLRKILQAVGCDYIDESEVSPGSLKQLSNKPF